MGPYGQRAETAARPGGRERGFTLLEVMVAFLIASLAVGAMARTTTVAIESTRAASRTDEAVTRAESHLAAISAAPLLDSDRQGEDGGGFHWHARISRTGVVHPAATLTDVPPGSVTLYRLTVVISWREDGRSRSMELDSAKLGPVQ